MVGRKLTLANNPLLSGPALKDRQKGGIPYRELELALIEADPNQPRVSFDEERLKELASSISMYGVLSPILVRPSRSAGKFQLIAGERRVRAAQMVGLETIPAIVDLQEGGQSDDRVLAIQLIENLQRADLTPLERAHAIGALRDRYKMSLREISAKLGVSKSMVQRSLEILDLPDDLLNALREGAAESKILLLSKIDDPEIRKAYLRDLEVLTRDKLKDSIASQGKETGKGESALSAEDARIVDELQRALGVKIRMNRSTSNEEAGKLTLEFYSKDDLQEIFRKLIAD